MGSQFSRSSSRARTRHIAYLLAGTALASASFAGEAAAACTVNAAGVVNCAANTTTTNTTNLNGATAASSDRIQEFNNGSNITATNGAGVTVDGFGLNLLLSNAGGNDTINIANNGLVTTNQAVTALELNGNGGTVTYGGTGRVTNTAGNRSALVATNTGAGNIDINVHALATIQANGSGTAIGAATSAGNVSIIGAGGTVIGGIGFILTSSTGAISVTGLSSIQGTESSGIFASGDAVTIAGNTSITGTDSATVDVRSALGGIQITGNSVISSPNSQAIRADSGFGSISITGNSVITGGIVADGSSALNNITIQGNGTINGAHNVGVVARTLGGSVFVTNNGNITGAVGNFGINADSAGGGLTISNNGNISSGTGIVAFSGGGGLSITGNGTITGNAVNAMFVHTQGGGLTITGNGAITGALHGISATTGGGVLSIQGNGSITGTFGDGISVSSGGGNLDIGGVTFNGAITGRQSGIVATSVNGIITIETNAAITGQTQAGIVTNSGGGLQFLTISPGGTVTGSANGIQANATTGNIFILNDGGGTVTGGTNAVFGSTTGWFSINNFGVLNGAINVTNSIVVLSGIFLAPASTWNTGTGNSSFSGDLGNSGILNAQNGVGGQAINIARNYAGAGTVRVDLGDRLQMGGTANLTGGTLNVVMAPNSPLAQTNVVLTAAGGLGGTTFATTSVTIPNVVATVTYTPTQVIVNVPAIQLGAGSNLNQNQQSVATSINNFFNGGGTLPASFVGLLGLPGPALANALTQMSGEVATGLQPAANLSMGMFLNAMIDPFVTGRTGGFGSAMSYAPETPSRVEVAAREAFAADMPVKARPPIATFEQRWSIWGAAYGGQNRTDGDVVVGSNDLRATAAGFAAGADYRVSRDTVMGMAVAVGQTRWNVSPALGKGHSDVGQIGAYASTRWDNMYLSGAIAFAWHKAETERTVTVAGTDRLEADFDATSIGGRLEGGYRFGGAQYGLTPYAAVQVQSLHTPAYSERATAGNNQFALTFGSQTTTDTRSELGFWADTRFPFAENTVVLRGRAAWVHDYNPGSRINPAFQTLPGASFTINGAAAPRDAALTSAVAEMRLTSGWTLIAKGDGEFSGRSTTLTGTGTARYTW